MISTAGHSLAVGTNDPSTQRASSGFNGGESNGEIELPSSNDRASPTPNKTSSGVNRAQSNTESGLPQSSNDRPSTDTNESSESTPLQRTSWCPCIFSACTGTDIASDVAYSGPDRFKLRELSDAEKYHLNRPIGDALKCSRVFADPVSRLKVWPRFFESTEASGLELRDGFVTLWTTFIVAETLLAAVAIQPFVTSIPNLSGWRFQVHGLLWMLALITDYMALSITAIFLGYLHGPPPKLSHIWLCNIGSWIGVPAVLVLSGAITGIVAVAFSTWVIYGYKVGIVCVTLQVFTVSFAIAAAKSLGKASGAAQALN